MFNILESDLKFQHNLAMPTSVSPPTTPQTFQLFPHLPTELRLKIWQHAHLLSNRVLTLSPVPWNDTLFPSSLPPNFFSAPKWTLSPSSIAPLMSVCSESRSEVEKLYSTRFKEEGVAPGKACQRPWDIPLCPQIDTLHVVLRKSVKIYDGTVKLFVELFGEKAREVMTNVRGLAGSERFWSNIREEGSISLFGNLEEAVLVLPGRTMRLVGSMDFSSCNGGIETEGFIEGEREQGRRVSSDGGKGGKERRLKMSMCAVGDLGREDMGAREVECDFMSSGTDIYVFA